MHYVFNAKCMPLKKIFLFLTLGFLDGLRDILFRIGAGRLPQSEPGPGRHALYPAGGSSAAVCRNHLVRTLLFPDHLQQRNPDHYRSLRAHGISHARGLAPRGYRGPRTRQPQQRRAGKGRSACTAGSEWLGGGLERSQRYLPGCIDLQCSDTYPFMARISQRGSLCL